VCIVQSFDAAQDVCTFAFTVMPDHVHWLFRLGDRLQLGQILAKFKAGSRGLLKAANAEWQRNFYERELRAEQEIEGYALYVFLNPYRAGLCPLDHIWPHWWTARPESLAFVAQLIPPGVPLCEWIDRPDPDYLLTGE